MTDLAAFIAQKDPELKGFSDAQKDPELKGFSDKNLWRMKQFFETYQADEKLS